MGLFDTQQDTRSQRIPWQPAMPGLDRSMELGEQALVDPWEAYGGQLVQALDPFQRQALQQMGHYGAPGGQGYGVSNSLYGAGQQGLPAFGQAQDIYSNVAGGPTPQVGQLDQGYAQNIANNPYTDSMIDAALRDSTRQLTEQTLPGIDMAAWQGGALGGSEQNQANQIAMRGYMDRAADVSAGIRNQNYGRGLGIANQQAMMNPQLQAQNYATQLGAGAGLRDIGTSASNMLGNSYGFGTGNIQQLLQAGNIYQGQGQNEIDAQMRNFYLGQQLPFQQAQAGMGMFAPLASNFGVQRGQQTQQFPLGQFLGGAFMQGMGGMKLPGFLGGVFGGGAGG